MTWRNGQYGKVVRVWMTLAEYERVKALVGVLTLQTRIPGGITLGSYTASALKRCVAIDCANAGIDPKELTTVNRIKSDMADNGETPDSEKD